MATVEHRVVDEDGELVAFHVDYEVIRTEIRVWSGKTDYLKKPIKQDGILFTHFVKPKENDG